MMEQREEIAIVGGGLGGCLTALMLAKNPRYHVTLIEGQDKLLNGASLIASRLHLGGEYPNDPKTASDCLISAIAWKMLMPKDIYTATPPMKFLVAQDTEDDGRANPDDPKSLTVTKYLTAYEKVRKQYERLRNRVQKVFPDEELFGSSDKNKFYRILDKSELTPYGDVAGGFQSNELGLNVPKYLAKIEAELKAQQELGNISIKLNHKVAKNGIIGDKGHFRIQCANGESIPADQVIQAAWDGGPELTPLTSKKRGGQGRSVTVYQRAMMLIDLPQGWNTGPAFIMLGKHGGMLAPYNDRTAICYLPTESAAYRGGHQVIDNRDPTLKPFTNVPDEDAEITRAKRVKDASYRSPREQWRDTYFYYLKERFPVLRGAKNPRLIIRNTLSFQKSLDRRQNDEIQEAMPINTRPAMMQELRIVQQQDMENPGPAIGEARPGLFTMYPTKATYTVFSALQAADMVERRSKTPITQTIHPPESALGLILSREGRGKYSLANMREGKPNIFAANRDLPSNMSYESWPGRSWSARIGTEENPQLAI